MSHGTKIFHWRTLWCFRIFFNRNFSSIGGSHHAFVEFFLSHRTETKSFVKEPFCFPENFWYRKIFWIRGGISRFSVEIFMSHSAEKFRKGILLFFRKFGVSKNFMHNRGYNVFCVEKFLSQSADKIRRRTLLCFRRILLPKIFKQRRVEASPFCRKIFSSHRTEKTSPGNHSVKLSGREKFFMDKRVGEVSQFSVEKFLSHCTKIFHWRSLCCFRKFYRKFSSIGGGHHGFVETFLSHRTEPKSFVKEPFCFPENFWYRKIFWIRRGISRFSVSIFMSHCAEKFRKGILLFFRKFLVSKSLMDEKGGYYVFPSKIFGLTVPKNFVGFPSIFRKI